MLGDDCCHFMIYLSILITEIQYNKIATILPLAANSKEISNENELEQMEYSSVLIL